MNQAADNLKNNDLTKQPTFPDTCFHCGLPVEESGIVPALPVLGKRRFFCCQGCRAVAEAIVDQGLEDYYRHRDSQSPNPERAGVPDFLADVELYDNVDIQSRFIRRVDGKADADGHPVGELREAQLILEDIRCPACVWLNEKTLRAMPGMIDVHMDYTRHQARVRWDAGQLKMSDILKAISLLGYRAHPFDPSHHEKLLKGQNRRSLERVWFAGMAMMIVMHFSLASYLIGPPVQGPEFAGLPLWMIIGRWTSLLVATVTLLYSGWEFLHGAFFDLRNRRLGMDVPIALGLLLAWVGSLASTIAQRGEVYFDSITMFIFFVLLARRYELKGRREAAARLDALARVVPEKVDRIREDGQIERIAAVSVNIGDRLRIDPGERVPLDGELLTASAELDESLLTGESRPVLHQRGEALVAGAVNVGVSLDIRVGLHDELRKAAGNGPNGDQGAQGDQGARSSTLEQIHRAAESALKARPGAARFADAIAKPFVAVVILLAIGTGLYWALNAPELALANTIAVLIVTCPCALALATPVAITLANGRLGERGIQSHNMEALAPIAKAPILALDKTGTLTLGRLERIASAYFPDRDHASETDAIAAWAAQYSEHPAARAIRMDSTAAQTLGEPTEQRHFPGQGIELITGQGRYRLGRPEFAVATFDESQLPASMDSLSLLALAKDDRLLAIYGLRDQAREKLRDSLDELRALGIEEIHLISGDRQTAVDQFVADHGLSLDSQLGELGPDAKRDWLETRRNLTGREIWMVGDGINDTPVLSAADVSLSFNEATELAKTRSDFVSLNPALDTLVSVRRIARRGYRIINENLAWALGYNLLAIPAAMIGWVPPWAAAIGMSVSSLIVVANSRRL